MMAKLKNGGGEEGERERETERGRERERRCTLHSTDLCVMIALLQCETSLYYTVHICMPHAAVQLVSFEKTGMHTVMYMYMYIPKQTHNS